MTTPAPTSHRIRRLTAGGSLILFCGLLVPQDLVDPAEGGTGEVMYRAATEQSTALTTSAVLLVISGVLMAPAAAGVLHQARDRGAGLANVGAVLAVLGGFGHFGIAMYYLVSLSLAGGDKAEMIAFVDRLNESAVLGAVAFPLILCFGLGVAVLPWAAWRAGAVGWWAPAVRHGGRRRRPGPALQQRRARPRDGHGAGRRLRLPGRPGAADDRLRVGRRPGGRPAARRPSRPEVHRRGT